MGSRYSFPQNPGINSVVDLRTTNLTINSTGVDEICCTAVIVPRTSGRILVMCSTSGRFVSTVPTNVEYELFVDGLASTAPGGRGASDSGQTGDLRRSTSFSTLVTVSISLPHTFQIRGRTTSVTFQIFPVSRTTTDHATLTLIEL